MRPGWVATERGPFCTAVIVVVTAAAVFDVVHDVAS
jgi:hypothetical protein